MAKAVFEVKELSSTFESQIKRRYDQNFQDYLKSKNQTKPTTKTKR